MKNKTYMYYQKQDIDFLTSYILVSFKPSVD